MLIFEEKGNGPIISTLIRYTFETLKIGEKDKFYNLIVKNLPNNEGEKIMTTIAESYRQEGAIIQSLEIAVRMLEANINIDLIASITGLPHDEIVQLKKQGATSSNFKIKVTEAKLVVS